MSPRSHLRPWLGGAVALLTLLSVRPVAAFEAELLALPRVGEAPVLRRVASGTTFGAKEMGTMTAMGTGGKVLATLPTSDGLDLLAFVKPGATSGITAQRLGRVSGDSFADVSTANLAMDAVTLAAALVGREQRYVALVPNASDTVRFYDAATLMPATPPGFQPMQPFPSGARIEKLVAAGEALFAKDFDPSVTAVYRLAPGAPGVRCDVGDKVRGILGLEDGRAVVLTESNLVVLPANCAAGQAIKEPLTPATFTGLAAVRRSKDEVYLFAAAVDKGSATLKALSLSATALKPVVEQNYSSGACCELAAIATPAGATLALGGGDLGQGVFLTTFDGGSFDKIAESESKIADFVPVLAMPARAFDLGPQRKIEITDSAFFLPLSGGDGERLKLRSLTCSLTGVPYVPMPLPIMVPSFGQSCDKGCPLTGCSGQSNQCSAPLSPTPGAEGSLRLPNPVPPGSALALTQTAPGETCLLAIGCDPTSAGACQGRGGGGLFRVSNDRRTLALVLDRSGSMICPLANGQLCDGTRPERQQALSTALNVFSGLLGQLNANQQGRVGFVVVPFNQDSSALPSPSMQDVWTAKELGDGLSGVVLPALTPDGLTNIRGALRTAGAKLEAQAGSKRMVLLMTDGIANQVGAPAEENQRCGPMSYCKEPKTPENACAAMYCSDSNDRLLEIADYLQAPLVNGQQRVDRLLTVGLSDQSYHPKLLELTQAVNGNDSAGFLEYTSDPQRLSKFFVKLFEQLANYKAAVDPIFTLDPGSSFKQIADVGGESDVLLVAAWSPGGRVDVSASYRTSTGQTGSARCVPGANFAICTGSVAGVYSMLLLNQGGSQVQVMLEVATRGSARQVLEVGSPLIIKTGSKLPLRVRLEELGLPIVGALEMSAQLRRPSSGLGTALALARISAADIARAAQTRGGDRLSPTAAKATLLGDDAVPKDELLEGLPLRDDGKSEDGLANDGTYGLLVDASVPGPYEFTVRSRFRSRLTGAEIFRESTMTVQVVVALTGAKTVQEVISQTLPQDGKPGTLVLRLLPQDQVGNLLGPGNGGSLTFLQAGRLLPTTVIESDDLDGGYVVTVNEIRVKGSVVLSGAGGVFELLRDPSAPAAGCGCEVGRASAHHPTALGVMILVLLGTALRRRRQGKLGHDSNL